MGSVNQGNQTIFPDYRMDADAPNFMKMRTNILPVGIYMGLEATKQGSDVVIEPGVMEIRDDGDRQVRVKTSDPITVTPTENEPWIIGEWEFNEEEDWWAEFKNVNNFLGNDIILAKAVYDNSGNFDSLDLSDRTYPTWAELDSTGSKVNEIRLVPNGNV